MRILHQDTRRLKWSQTLGQAATGVSALVMQLADGTTIDRTQT